MSLEVGGGKPTDLGEVMSKKVDAMGPLEVEKGNNPEVGKRMPQENDKNIIVDNIMNEKFQKDCKCKHNLKTGLSKKKKFRKPQMSVG